jgi:hypothetical protein
VLHSFFLFSKFSLVSGIKKAALEGGLGERRKTNAYLIMMIAILVKAAPK